MGYLIAPSWSHDREATPPLARPGPTVSTPFSRHRLKDMLELAPCCSWLCLLLLQLAISQILGGPAQVPGRSPAWPHTMRGATAKTLNCVKSQRYHTTWWGLVSAQEMRWEGLVYSPAQRTQLARRQGSCVVSLGREKRRKLTISNMDEPRTQECYVKEIRYKKNRETCGAIRGQTQRQKANWMRLWVARVCHSSACRAQ